MTIQQHASFDSSAAELNATSKLVKAWESKNAKNAAKAGGVSLMALSLAACGGSSTPVADAPADDPVVVKATNFTTTTKETLNGTSGNDKFAGQISATASKQTFDADDSLVDASTTDADVLTLAIEDDVAAASTPGVRNIETININLDTTTSGDSSNTPTELELVVSDFTGVSTFNVDNTATTTAVSILDMSGVNDGATVNVSADFTTVEVGVSAVGDDITLDVAAAGSAGNSVTVALDTNAAADATVEAAGYAAFTSSNTGSLTFDAGNTSSATAASAVIIDAEVAAGNLTVADATASVSTTAKAPGSVTVTKGAAGGKIAIEAGSTATVNGTTAQLATDISIKAVGASTVGADSVSTLSLEGNGAALTVDMGATHQDLLEVNVKGDEDVTLKIKAGELVSNSGASDTDASLYVTDTGSGTFTLEVSDANQALDISSAVVDRVEIKTADMVDGKVLTVASGQDVTFTASQADGNTTANDIVVGTAAAKATNKVTLTLDDESTAAGTVDLTLIEVAQAGTVNIVASGDTTAAGARNASTLTSFEASDVENGVINIDGGVNGIKTATALTGHATSTINITGSGKVELQTTDVTAALLDASKVTGVVSSTGGLTSKLKAIKTGSADDALVFAGAGTIDIDTGKGNDKITLDDATYTGHAVSIEGGDGTDTLVLTSAASAATSLVTGAGGSISLSGIETIQMIDHDTAIGIDGDLLHKATYGVEFTTAGADQLVNVTVKTTDTAIDLSSLVGSASSATSVAASTFSIDAGSNTSSIAITGMTAAKNTIEGSATSGDVLTGGGKADTFVYGSDALLFDASNVMQDTIVGGVGTDTLKLSATASAVTVVAADSWAKASTMESITSGVNTGAISLTLGATAETAGFSKVDLSGDTSATGANVISVASYSKAATLTGSAGVDTITGGAGGDTITGGAGIDVLAGGAGDDTFSFAVLADLFQASANNLIDGSIKGGDGTDTIQYVVTSATAAVALDDADPFADVTSVEVLKTSGTTAQNITVDIDVTAYAAGITTVDFSSDTNVTGDNIIDLNEMTGGMTVIGGAGVETITGTGSVDTIRGGGGADVIDGGSGADVLVFEATGAANGVDVITFAIADDKLDFTAFLGDAYSVLDGNGVTAGIGSYTASTNDDVDITGKVAIWEDSADTTTNVPTGVTKAEIFAEIDGASDAFSLSAGKAVIITVDENTDAAASNSADPEVAMDVWYVDTTLDGVAGLSLNDIVLVGAFETTSGAVHDTFAATNFVA